MHIKFSLSKNKGFTLVELIIVISLIIIIAAMTTLLWPGDNIILQSQIQQLANDIRYTQYLAISHAQRYRITFSTNSYSITDINNNIVSNNITNQSNTTLTNSVTITLPPTNLPNNVIAFDSTGTPYIDSAATIPLSSVATLTVNKNSLTDSLTIQPQTGKVTC